MAEKPVLKIGHLQITDHLILGITDLKVKRGKETFHHCTLEPVVKTGWMEIADGLADGSLDGAFVLAPTAMDLFYSGVGLKLILFAHRAGSVLVKSKNADIRQAEDFSGKFVLIPYQLSVHNMLFHRLLAEKGLKSGKSGQDGVEVFLEEMAPAMMPDVLKEDEDGEIAGFMVAEPFATQAITEGYCEAYCLSKDLWADHPCCVVVMNDDIIDKHPDAVQELTHSLVKSGIAAYAKPSAASVVGAPFLSQEHPLVEKVLTDPPDRITTNRLFPVIEDLAAIQDYMLDEMGLLKGKIDLEKLVDTRFAEAAEAK